MTDMTATPQQPAPGGPETEIESAEAFAERYCGWDPHHTLTAMVEQRDAQIAAQALAKVEEYRAAIDHFPTWLHREDVAENIDLLIAGIRALAAAQEPASDPQPETGRS